MKTEIVNPNISNFIKSLRDVGYTFEIAVADVLDNSISANASKIDILGLPEPEPFFCILDNGTGMSEPELMEAMRLATKSPDDARHEKDLGRFGLGLKTASFSQCKSLTVASKKNDRISIKKWDLDYLEKKNEWFLITPEPSEYSHLEMFDKLSQLESGTLVIWEKLDRFKKEDFAQKLDELRKHVSLVFHRFMESSFNKLEITINNKKLIPFNPFNVQHSATLEKASENIKIYDSTITVTPYILPHHQKVSQQEWDQFSTSEGYIKSQGFYLYRLNRLLIHGTWWGLHKASDAHKLVRVRIDIPNNTDRYWGIDIKKSTAYPMPEIRKDLKRIIDEITKDGAKPFTTRGRRIKDKTVKRFWELIPVQDCLRFGLNKEHPLYIQLNNSLNDSQRDILNIYMKGLEAYLPLESIQSYIQQRPHDIKQKDSVSSEDLQDIIEKLKAANVNPDYIDDLLKSELFENYVRNKI